MNRGNRPVQQNAHPDVNGTEAPKGPVRRSVGGKEGKLAKFGFLGFVAIVTILIVAIVVALALPKGKGSSEFSNVDKTKLQAVFLNGGQVYFGKVSELNSKYLELDNIYYLRVNQQVQPNQTNTNASADDISLVKLGCELHGPQDSMVINREQIIFWENLKDDGQVAKAVAEYQKANPNGQKCDEQQNTGTNNTTTNPTNTGTGTGTTNNTNTSGNR